MGKSSIFSWQHWYTVAVKLRIILASKFKIQSRHKQPASCFFFINKGSYVDAETYSLRISQRLYLWYIIRLQKYTFSLVVEDHLRWQLKMMVMTSVQSIYMHCCQIFFIPETNIQKMKENHCYFLYLHTAWSAIIYLYYHLSGEIWNYSWCTSGSYFLKQQPNKKLFTQSQSATVYFICMISFFFFFFLLSTFHWLILWLISRTWLDRF